MKVVIDTNVFVSGLIKPGGVSDQVLRHHTPYTLFTSEEILAELARVLHYDRLRRRYRLNEEVITGYVQTIRADSEVIETSGHAQRVQPDPDDDKFLVCAVEAQVDYIISGDPHLTNLGSYQNIPILTPRQFLDLLERIV